MSEQGTFYIYLHRALSPREKGDVFYVGKGRGKRAWRKQGRNPHWKRAADKHGYVVDILMDGLTERQAFDLEINLIAQYGRNRLCNETDGGDGMSNPSEETRAKLSASRMGNSHGKSLAGIIRSEETRAKMSVASMGNTRCVGRTLSEYHKAQIVASNTKRILSEDTKLKMSIAAAARKDRKRSERGQWLCLSATA